MSLSSTRSIHESGILGSLCLSEPDLFPPESAEDMAVDSPNFVDGYQQRSISPLFFEEAQQQRRLRIDLRLSSSFKDPSLLPADSSEAASPNAEDIHQEEAPSKWFTFPDLSATAADVHSTALPMIQSSVVTTSTSSANSSNHPHQLPTPPHAFAAVPVSSSNSSSSTANSSNHPHQLPTPPHAFAAAPSLISPYMLTNPYALPLHHYPVAPYHPVMAQIYYAPQYNQNLSLPKAGLSFDARPLLAASFSSVPASAEDETEDAEPEPSIAAVSSSSAYASRQDETEDAEPEPSIAAVSSSSAIARRKKYEQEQTPISQPPTSGSRKRKAESLNAGQAKEAPKSLKKRKIQDLTQEDLTPEQSNIEKSAAKRFAFVEKMLKRGNREKLPIRPFLRFVLGYLAKPKLALNDTTLKKILHSIRQHGESLNNSTFFKAQCSEICNCVPSPNQHPEFLVHIARHYDDRSLFKATESFAYFRSMINRYPKLKNFVSQL